MRREITTLKLSSFPKRLLDADYQVAVVGAQKKIKAEYGFTAAEMEHLMRHKPSIVLYEEDYLQGKGLKMLKEFLCEDMKLTHA